MGVWDKTTPVGSDPKSQGDDRIREAKAAIEEALQGGAAEGDEAIFPGTSPSTAPVFHYRGLKGSTGSRPAAGQYGLYFDTTRGVLQRDNGSTWDDIGAVVPAGTVTDFAGSSAPEDWLLCDGSAIDRTVYARLFAVIGVVYGSGNGSTTFNIPDARGRSTIGAGSGSGLTVRTLAAAGGEENHALTTAELAAHSHGVTDPGHGHTGAGHDNDGSGDKRYSGAKSFAAAQDNIVVINSNTTGISINNAGSSDAHNNMQPFLALNKIIKI